MTAYAGIPGERQATGKTGRWSRKVHRRRLVFGLLVGMTGLWMTVLMVLTLSRGGYDLLDFLLTVAFMLTLPWTVVGFWNALIGLLIMRLSQDPARIVYPSAASLDDDEPVTGSTAVLMCVRNEDAHEVARKLDVLVDSLVSTGAAAKFHIHVLSDSARDENVEVEREVFGRLQNRWQGILPVTYRRRDNNAGYKAGNIREFCERWGMRHDYALVLDADSLMAAESVLRLVRTMDRNTRLGILQSLVVGMPTLSPFARVFQFGMRLGMRSYTLGSAWWQADCGPYWGHNALIRLEPFIEHCQLPALPGRPPLGGTILSHDQVEAALMRRAGYEVRVLPEEGGSWEENPPTLLEYLRRDLRWCHGNMQYWQLLGMPGLKPVSRLQLLLAIFMYLGSPAWVAFMTIGALRVGLAEHPEQLFHADTGWVLFAFVMTMVFAPKLVTLANMVATPRSSRAFGGRVPLLIGASGEIVISTVLAPVIALAHTRFLLGLPFGRASAWPAQRRGTHAVSPADAAMRLWPQTVFGASMVTWLALASPAALVGFMPFLLGSVLAVPIAVVTSWPGLGKVLSTRLGLWRIPDEIAPAKELQSLRLPALHRAKNPLATSRAVLHTGRSD